jgi:hypothetical protein
MRQAVRAPNMHVSGTMAMAETRWYLRTHACVLRVPTPHDADGQPPYREVHGSTANCAVPSVSRNEWAHPAARVRARR